MKTLLITLLLALTGCQTVPDRLTGVDCWRYGVLEEGNTGKMTVTPVENIRVVKLGYEDLLVACGVVDDRTLAGAYMDGRSMVLRACFKPREVDGKAGEDIIYSYNLNLGDHNYYVEHERCHAILGREHNSCWNNGYGIGADKSACEWNTG